MPEQAFNLMANGISPAEIGIDIVPLLTQYGDWSPRVDEWEARLPNLRRLFATKRCAAWRR